MRATLSGAELNLDIPPLDVAEIMQPAQSPCTTGDRVGKSLINTPTTGGSSGWAWALLGHSASPMRSVVSARRLLRSPRRTMMDGQHPPGATADQADKKGAAVHLLAARPPTHYRVTEGRQRVWAG